jgi:pycsar effector protein
MDKDALIDALDRVQESIRAADHKAGFLLATLGVLLAFRTPALLVHERAANAPPLPLVVILLALLALGTYIVGLIWSFLVLFPRTDNISETQSLIYWGDVAGFKNATEYIAQVNDRARDVYIEDLASQVYVNAVIATRKHANFKIAVRATAIGIALLIVCYGVTAWL